MYQSLWTPLTYHIVTSHGFCSSLCYTSAITAILCRFLTQTTPIVNGLSIVMDFGQWSHVQTRKELHCQKWRHYMARRLLSKPICAKEEPSKGFLQLSPKAAMLSWPTAETYPPPPVPSLLLAQNPSPKDIAGIDITNWSSMMLISVYRN